MHMVRGSETGLGDLTWITDQNLNIQPNPNKNNLIHKNITAPWPRLHVVNPQEKENEFYCCASYFHQASITSAKAMVVRKVKLSL